MTVTIQLPSEMEAALIKQADAFGFDLSRYVEHLLRKQLNTSLSPQLSPAERANEWRKSTHDLPNTPPLSDDAIGRESLYGDRGR